MENKLKIDKGSRKEFWDEQHIALASEQVVWIISADELLRAFDLLARQAEADVRPIMEPTDIPPLNVSNAAMMLGALAIENLLKAICLPNTQPLVDDRGAFMLKTHDLLKLSTVAAIPLSSEEHILLERLEQFLTWAGRYPISLFSEDMRPRILPNGGSAPRTIVMIPNDFTAISTFAKKLKELLPELNYEQSNT